MGGGGGGDEPTIRKPMHASLRWLSVVGGSCSTRVRTCSASGELSESVTDSSIGGRQGGSRCSFSRALDRRVDVDDGDEWPLGWVVRG